MRIAAKVQKRKLESPPLVRESRKRQEVEICLLPSSRLIRHQPGGSSLAKNPERRALSLILPVLLILTDSSLPHGPIYTPSLFQSLRADP